jgi:malonyl-CoA decarboxylase
MRRHEPSVEEALRLSAELMSTRGEASGVAIARDVLATYAALAAPEKTRALQALAKDFAAPRDALEQAARAYLDAPGEATAGRLFRAAEPPRQELIRRLNFAPGGAQALVKLREDLLDRLPEHPELKALDDDLVHLFSAWFNRGFLVLRKIDWSTPASILEKIIRYEAVHAIEGWDDLRRRLEPRDRRLFAFFHPALADEPLIFVQVALTDQTPNAIQPLLAPTRGGEPTKAPTTAVFYSISNAQKGLAGISFGNFLIKQVVEDLRRETSSLTTFVTLSPAPGFAKWLEKEIADPASAVVTTEDRRVLALLGKPGWAQKTAAAEAAERALAPLAAHYFLKAKSGGERSAGRPADPVARFHLGNGARLERINLMADLSPRGLTQSHGVMVNYLYDLGYIEQNHEAFAERGEIAASSAVRRQLRSTSPFRF